MSRHSDHDRVSVAKSVHGPDTPSSVAAFAQARERDEAAEQAPPAEERETATTKGPLPPDPFRYMRLRASLGLTSLDRGHEPGRG
jgi:hypothetical protein